MALIGIAIVQFQYTVYAQASRILECKSVFRADATAASLSDHFGAANVSRADIEIGEGVTETGTVLFADSPEDRLEIIWKDIQRQQRPRAVFLRETKTRWRTATGLTMGLNLIMVERLNGRLFRLAGFGFDYSGTVLSWSGGLIETAMSGCSVRARLMPDMPPEDGERLRWYKQVIGDKEFSSGHPAMRALNPTVYEVFLDYP